MDFRGDDRGRDVPSLDDQISMAHSNMGGGFDQSQGFSQVGVSSGFSTAYSLPYGQHAPYQQSYGVGGRSPRPLAGLESGYGVGMPSRVLNEAQHPPSREALARLHGVPPIVERPDIVITQGMPIPEQKIGWIIGSRGSYVKQLEQRSGCSLRISDDTSTEYGVVWRYVMMRGTGIALMRCKQLIQMRLDLLPPSAATGAQALSHGRQNYPAPYEDQYTATGVYDSGIPR